MTNKHSDTSPIPGLHWKACLPNVSSSTISDRLLCSICKSTNLFSPPTRSSASTSSVLLIVHPQTSFVRSFNLSNSWQNSWRDFSLPIFEVSYDIMANINKCDKYSSSSFSYRLLYNIECNRQPSRYPRRHHGPCSSRKRTAERGWVWWQREYIASLS